MHSFSLSSSLSLNYYTVVVWCFDLQIKKIYMGITNKRVQHLVVLWLLLVTLIFLGGHTCCCTRRSQVLKSKTPKGTSPTPRSFFGFLPKGFPIPPSGPSRQHNAFGSEQSPWIFRYTLRCEHPKICEVMNFWPFLNNFLFLLCLYNSYYICIVYTCLI